MKIKKNHLILIVLAGLIPAGVVAVLLFSGPHMRNQPSLRAYEERVNLMPALSVPYTPGQESAREAGLPEQTPESLNRGRVYYNYYCVFCHGDDGKGNGPVGESYMPRPADLTGDAIQSYSLERLHDASFSGTGHSPVLERVVPPKHRPYILYYLKNKW